jgi:hypothetical protein
MLCLKEWLELDRIRTEVYEPALNEIIAEMAAKKTARFFLESMEEEDDDGTPAELADPFDGSDDAKPIEDRSQEEETPEGEKLTAQEKEKEKERKRIRDSIRVSQYGVSDGSILQLDDGTKLNSTREIATALKNAALWIRWNGILERKKEVQRLKSMTDGDSESEDPFEDMMNSKSNISVEDAIPILEKLGYINYKKIDENDKLSDEAKENEVKKALEKAIKESDNELPSGISEEQVEKKNNSAKRDFMAILYHVFGEEYKKLSRSSWNVGDKLYSSDELANVFIMRMLDALRTRRIQDGSAKPWGGLISDKKNKAGGRSSSLSKRWFGFGKSGESELANDDSVDEILGIFQNKLYREPHKASDERRKSISPSRGVADEIKNRSKKSSRINIDVNKALEDQAEGNEPESLKQYVDFLNAFLQGKEKTYDKKSMTEEQKFRYEIIEAIVSKQSAYPDMLSLDPDKMLQTLFNFRRFFVKKSASGPSMMGSEDSEGKSTGLEQSASFQAYRRGASNRPDEGLSGGGAAGSVAAGNNTRRIIIEKLAEVMNNLKIKNSTWALAVCLKFGLGCHADGSITSPENLLNAGILRTKGGQVKGANKLGCRNQLDAIGLTTIEVQKKLDKLGLEVGASNALQKGLEFVCSELQKLLMPALQGTPASSTSPNTRFDASKPSPLSGMMKRTQG